MTYKDRLSFVGSATEAEWKPIVRTSRRVPSMQTGTQNVEVNETEPHGVVFVMRPPDLRMEPQREDHDESTDEETKMEKICERIRRVRKGDLSDKSLAFWKALEQLHQKGRRAASVPSLPHTECADGHEFTFDGCPQPLRPLLHDLMRFERPLITWDIFNAAPPAEFCAPAALHLTGPAATPVGQLAITGQPSQPSQPPRPFGMAPDAGATKRAIPLPLPCAELPTGTAAPLAPQGKLAAAQPAPPPGASSAEASRNTAVLRDPRVANAVTHSSYQKKEQLRDEAELDFEAWTREFPGRVEKVESNRLYVVRLDEADGELLLGLVASEGKVFTRMDDETREEVPHINSLWFKRCSDANRAWGANPEFEWYKDKTGKRDQQLPTESFLLEVEDSDLTDSSVARKWTKPKFKQTLMKKLRWIAEKYELQADAPRAPAAAPAAAKRTKTHK